MFVIMAAFGAMLLTDYQRHGTLLLVTTVAAGLLVTRSCAT